MSRAPGRPATSMLLSFAVGCWSLQSACESDDARSTGDGASSTSGSSATTTNGSAGTGGATTSSGSAGAPGGAGGASGASGASGAGAGDTGPVVGTFEIEIVPEKNETALSPARDAFTSIVGRVYEYPVPSQIDWELKDERAGCQLLVPRIPFCDPGCSAGAVCGENDECTAFPETYDLGGVTLTGVATETGDSVTMDPLPPSNTYQPLASAGIEYPPFAAGDTVTLDTEGGDLEPFSISATGIDELVLIDPEDAWLFAPDEPAELTWEVPEGENSHVEVVIDISHHGGQKGEIVCRGDDNGSLTIPVELVDGLIDLGFSGFPSVLVSRVAVGAADTSAGRIELKLVNAVERLIEIPGLVSCEEAGSTDECPDGQSCQDDLKCG